VGHERDGVADLAVEALVLSVGVYGVGREPEQGQAGAEQDDKGEHEPEPQCHRAHAFTILLILADPAQVGSGRPSVTRVGWDP
jgi:hypothetical protein